MKTAQNLSFSTATHYLIAIIPLVVSLVWFISVLDKRISLLEQNQTYIAEKLSDLGSKIVRIGENSERLYQLISEKRTLPNV